MRVGMLTGGGDCPGLNAVMRAVVRKGDQLWGVEEADDLEHEDPADLPSGDALAAEVERFLRDEHRD